MLVPPSLLLPDKIERSSDRLTPRDVFESPLSFSPSPHVVSLSLDIIETRRVPLWVLCTLLAHERAIGSSIKLKYRKDFVRGGKDVETK